MKLLSRVSSVCLLSLAMGGCQSVAVPDLKARLGSINFDAASYVVRAGETLETIAFRYNIPVATLQQMNPQAANGVHTGMYLNIRQSDNSTRQAGRFAGRPDLDQYADRGNVARTTPIQSQQAVPIATAPSDNYLLGTERYNRPVVMPRENQSTGYVQQPGFPVEEVIDDENFVLPNSASDEDESLSSFVGGWQWPLNGQLARDFDPQRANGRGIEIVGMPGQQVYATRDGVVDWVARSPDGVGKVVIVRHDEDYLSIYSNTEDLYVSMRDRVRQGDPIASLGANVNDEQLLRFEISKDGNLLNPMDFLSPR